MAHDEMTTTVPEHRTLEPARWWDRRARGLGPSTARPCVSCAEENLLAFPGDPYPRESILVHEFAHAVDLMALRTLDPAFESKLAAAYRSALAGGLWKGTYAAENKEEYWAEGVQSWFDTNRPEDGLHNGIDTRRELIQYDPQLARLIGEALGKGTWRYVHPRDRLGQAHLAGYDPAQAPRFRWPEGLDAWFREHERSERAGAGHVELEPLPATEAPRRSPATRDATRIVFRNRTADAVTLFWVDHGGQRVAYGSVDAGADVERATLVGHVWIAVDATGKDLACFIASRRLGRAVIRPRGLGR